MAILASLAAAAGCGGSTSSHDDGEAGRSSGGAAGSTASQGGQTSGGQGGSGGSGATTTGGTSGAGTVGLDPPAPGVPCGETTCDGDAGWCCADQSSYRCEASQCTGITYSMECDDAVDCPGQLCCFVNIFASVRFATLCVDECGPASSEIGVCKDAGDCENGEACRAYTCSGRALGLCAATAPYFCE